MSQATATIVPAIALAHTSPNILDTLSDPELISALWDLDLWLRPEQRIPSGNWSSFGFIGARGFGKSLAIAYEINRRVEAGETRSLALMAPNTKRVEEVQIAFLVDTSPPWFRAERYNDTIVWPNGVVAECFTPLAPGRSRSGNFDTAWLCEIVDWEPNTMLEAFQNIVTATRVGRAQVIWDTTSKGKNVVIQKLLSNHATNPKQHIIRRGVTFDNPMLSRAYLQSVCSLWDRGSRRYAEEILGEVFAESAGALWQQDWIDKHRRPAPTASPDVTLLSLDPALSARSDSDETGLIEGCRDATSQEIYITHDYSGRLTPEQWASIVVDRCASGVSGVVVERNHLGDAPRDLLKVHAAQRGIRVQLLEAQEPFPRHRPGVLHIKEQVARSSKGSRGEAPAALYARGVVHHVGIHDLLELELTTWEPGVGKSPNRLDSACYLVSELAGIKLEKRASSEEIVGAAAAAQRELRSSLLGGRRSRRIGL